MKKDGLTLPDGYRLVREVDIQKNKKLSVWLNVAALVIAAGMAIGALFLRKSEGSFTVDGTTLLVFLGMFVATILYLFAHEGVHGIFIYYFCKKRPQFGFTGFYAYAGQKDAYFSKRHYAVIALAPVVLLGVLLLLLNLLFPAWFWAIYFIQVMNLSGAVGDLYVTALLSKLPADTLCNDDGVSMRFYSASLSD